MAMSDLERPATGKIELHNWNDFAKVMEVMGAGKWIYRGHEDVDWRLKSTLDRHVDEILSVHKNWSRAAFVLNLPRAELFAISKFREMAKKFQDLDSDAAALIAMQHYGAKTRLLDFTMSIMVALFFAYEKRVTGKKRAIYAVNYDSLMNQNGVWNGYQAFLKRIATEEHERRNIDHESEQVWWNLESQFENYYFQRYTAEVAAANIWSCTPSDDKGIIPLYKPAYNGRQMAQAGIELMPRTFDGFVENLAVALNIKTADKIVNLPNLITGPVPQIENLESKLPSALVKLEFDAGMEDDAWQILDQANINAATIYPDMEGVAKSVRYSQMIILGPTKAKQAARSGWGDLASVVRQTFPTWNGHDVVAFLEKMKIKGLDFKRLAVLHDTLAVSDKSVSALNPSVAIGETDVQFIKDVTIRIRRLATIASVLIPRSKVFTRSLEDTILSATEEMVKNSYSHVPILDSYGKVIGVFSESTMLEMNKAEFNNTILVTMRDIADFLPMDKHTADVFMFVPRNDAVLHLRQLCDEALRKRQRIGMFFVTETGKSDEPLLGILTVWDIAGASDVNDI